MTLVDTSAWVEFLRATGSTAHRIVRQQLESGGELHTTDVVVMELLAGGRDDAHVSQLRRLLLRCTFLPVQGLDDYERAAAIYRRCGRGGATVRALNDCLIAAIAIRAGVRVIHADHDFDMIARSTELEVEAG